MLLFTVLQYLETLQGLPLVHFCFENLLLLGRLRLVRPGRPIHAGDVPVSEAMSLVT